LDQIGAAISVAPAAVTDKKLRVVFVPPADAHSGTYGSGFPAFALFAFSVRAQMGSATAQTDNANSNAASEDDSRLWAAANEDKYKCADTGVWRPASEQLECQQQAIDNGFGFYSYQPARSKCYISEACDVPDQTQANWQIFANGTNHWQP
jgi:hypothetical protein